MQNHIPYKPNGIRHQNAHLSSLNFPEDYNNRLCKWVKNPSGFLVFIGNPGIGKTYFCSALGNFFAEDGQPKTLYFNERELFSMLRKRIGDSNFDYGDELIKMANYEYVMGKKYIWMIDDIGSSQMTEWQKEVLSTFIDELYRAKTPTVITSNFLLKEMSEKFSPRFSSRLSSAENVIMHLNLEDKRQLGL